LVKLNTEIWDSFMILTNTRYQGFTAEIQSDPIDSFKPQADTWVKLRDRPNDYSDDEALLLCEIDAGAWLGWVAGFGQIELQPGVFYRIT
jgi:hypothetical protein